MYKKAWGSGWYLVTWPWVRGVTRSWKARWGQIAKGFQPAERLEFYPGSNKMSSKVLRQRGDELGHSGFDWRESGRAGEKGVGRKTQGTLSPSLGAHHLCIRWCYAHVMDEKKSLHRCTLFLSLMYILVYLFLGIYILYLYYNITLPFLSLNECYFHSNMS